MRFTKLLIPAVTVSVTAFVLGLGGLQSSMPKTVW